MRNMTIKRIRLLKDNLSWFSIDKYNQTNNFTLNDWYSALRVRHLLGGVLRKDTLLRNDDDSKKMLGCLMKILLMPLGSSDLHNNTQSMTFSRGARLVWDRTVGDAFDDREIINEASSDGIRAVYDLWLSSFDNYDPHSPPQYPAQLNESLWAFKRGLFSCSDDFSINVNLSGSDDKIITDFTEWLSGMRETLASTTPIKSVNDLEMRNWGKYKVLAYIDLDIFCFLTNSKITQATLGNMLFPKEFGIDFTERVRKVVAPMAKRLMDSKFIDALDIQLGKAEREKQKIIPE